LPVYPAHHPLSISSCLSIPLTKNLRKPKRNNALQHFTLPSSQFFNIKIKLRVIFYPTCNLTKKPAFG
ncbi:MAG TPA: hypothetical protein VFV08_00425, partial [Puia sp.]|nr:hypothetical protein [Puia sp.]